MNKTNVMRFLPLFVTIITSTLAHSAKAQYAVSEPAGFVRYHVMSGTSVKVTSPFDSFGTNLVEALCDQLSGEAAEDIADCILFWDPVYQEYHTVFKADNTGNGVYDGHWYNEGTNWIENSDSFYPGEAFWIVNRHGDQQVYLFGKILLTESETQLLTEGYNSIANPYFTALQLNDLEFYESGAAAGSNAVTSDLIITGDNTNWLSESDGLWHMAGDGISTGTLSLAEGIWYFNRSSNALNWVISRPYTNIFSTATDTPRIVSVEPAAGGQSVILDIDMSGESGEKIEIFYQDVTFSNAMVSDRWQLADENLTGDGYQITWEDTCSVSRAAVNTVDSRLYVASRQDHDTDNDNLSDAREQLVEKTSVYKSDTDADGLDDGTEAQGSTDPLDADTDNDGMIDGTEGLYGLDAASDNGYPLIPWNVGFEIAEGYTNGALAGQQDWMVDGSAAVQDADAAEGDRSVQLQASSELSAVSHYCVSQTGMVVWTTMKLKMGFGALPETISAHSSVAVALNENRQLSGYDGNNFAWQTATNTLPVPAGNWVQLTVRSDYASGTWSLYCNGVPVLKNLGFADRALRQYSRLKIQGRKLGGDKLDAINVTQAKPGFIDEDNDGLPDIQEDINGNELADAGETSLYIADSDNDGMDDGAETAWGQSPLTSNKYAAVPYAAGFEASEGYTVGSLSNQQEWVAASASIQTATVNSGSAALKLEATSTQNAQAIQYFQKPVSDSIWVDSWVRLQPGRLPDAVQLVTNNSLIIAIDDNADLCVWDSQNNSWRYTDVSYRLPADHWSRLTVHLDYRHKTCDLYLDTQIVFENLPMSDESVRGLSRIKLMQNVTYSGQTDAYLDSLQVAASLLPTSDSDNDGLPDSWEQEHFGSLTETAMSDFDNDGIPNGAEYARGTNPSDSTSNSLTLYADSTIGDDSYDGLAATVADGHGPKAQISSAVAAAFNNDTINIATGNYPESGLFGNTRVILVPVGTVTVTP